MTDPIKQALDALKSTLCDPEGNVCIDGSGEDRAIIQRCLAALEGLEKAESVAELHPHHLRPSEYGKHWCREVLLYSGNNPGDKLDGKNPRIKLYTHPPLSSWQPIETAPKDGRLVLLWGQWAGEINGLSETNTLDIGYWTNGKSDLPGDDWWNLVTGDAYASWMRPTHWMEYPKGPK